MNGDIRELAYEEAQRLLETCFSFYNPYTCIIEAEGVEYDEREDFYRLVEEELLCKGERIRREGQYFKISKYQKWH